MARGPDPDVSPREILLYMVQSPDPAFTANEIAGEFGKSRQWADNRMKSLEKDEYVQSKNPGGRSRFYWITEKGKEYLRETRDQES